MLVNVQEKESPAMAFSELKARQSVMWGNGPYERITNTLRDIHSLVIERVEADAGLPEGFLQVHVPAP